VRTDPALIARLAGEIDERFRGAKLRDLGLLPDGRTALLLRSRGHEHALCIDIFSTPPLLTLEEHELPIVSEPGFIRAAGAALRGSTLLGAKARKGDRLLRLTFGTRSRFGVGDESELYVELVPRFGNIVLVRKERIVAAAKEFSLAENPARAVQPGMPYALPPLVARPRSDAEPAMPGSVLEAMAAFRSNRALAGESARSERRRSALLKRLDERARKLGRELAAIASKRRAAEQRDELRAQGEALYARLHELDADAQSAAKDEATKLFARYRKLGASIVHLELREQALNATNDAIDHLRWEAERSTDADLGDVESAVEHLEPRRNRERSAPARRKRAPLEIRTASGSRILVGRSPLENADITFRVARPNDLWFHAQNIPSAHVILQRDDKSEPPVEDLERAASLAAYYSKARSSAKVPIDYTFRKYVRAQKDAPPGLVWYTNPKTIVTEPREA
jgi:predicted ribosome quality control (RQC) complex YloA/Tae2 family protein